MSENSLVKEERHIRRRNERGNDGTEASAFDDDTRVRFAADLGDDRANELSLAVAIGPDHQVRRAPRLVRQVRLDPLVVAVLRHERLDARLEQVDGVARLPPAVLVVEIVARQVSRDGRDDKVCEPRPSHAVREGVVLDPRRMARISLSGRERRRGQQRSSEMGKPRQRIEPSESCRPRGSG